VDWRAERTDGGPTEAPAARQLLAPDIDVLDPDDFDADVVESDTDDESDPHAD
jgi:hypothetical protein